MHNYILLTEKKWHIELYELLKLKIDQNWILIDNKKDFKVEKLKKIKPDKIFIPHWSYIIPSEIFDYFDCVVFHMTDLPYGRGGSPLQNLIARGHSSTKISALKVTKGIDTGDVYLKKELSLYGSAEEIFIRSTKIIFSMVEEIITGNLEPSPQKGEVVQFKRRKPAEGDISKLKSLSEVFDYIRMLDAEGYPNAFLDIGNFRLEFSRANYKSSDSVLADVRISEK
ncbi:methionyl-tRNA formyltransferase [Gramella sp. Hel_I_59]|uniref:formyltransferase family protein n=1 Tax=Gramella sp. Hel_I_59 TaxID=1249978 RepID=UPI0011544C0B|nr:formyltransferase family protein [Gramella sp. Hel_I_59]TQI70413.1 methionyl-tRNA formyltransferase [Gramella sp. Hel_I_59]